MTEALLPVPPSVNKTFRNANAKDLARGSRGRVKTTEYTRWIKSAGIILNAARLKAPAPAMVCIRVGKVNMARDLDNFGKASMDLLVKCGVLKGDNITHVRAVFIVEAFGAVPDSFIGLSVVTPPDQFLAPHLAEQVI